MSESTDNVEHEPLSADSDGRAKDADVEQQLDTSTMPTNGANSKGTRRKRGQDAERVPSDPQAMRAQEFLSEVIAQMEMDCRVKLLASKEEDDRDIRLEILGEDAGRIIGKKGQVLSALQFLTNRILNRPGEERRYVNVDAEGYRSRRDNSLAVMAKRLGKQAMTDGKIITFEPMPPRDRRVVHLALAKLDGVVTRSEGEGETRRVQIIPVRR